MMTEEGKLLYEQALEASQDLSEKLTHVSIRIPSNDTSLIESTKKVFGEEYILEDGSVKLTYEMYRSLVNLIRDLGKLTSNEVLS